MEKPTQQTNKNNNQGFGMQGKIHSLTCRFDFLEEREVTVERFIFDERSRERPSPPHMMSRRRTAREPRSPPTKTLSDECRRGIIDWFRRREPRAGEGGRRREIHLRWEIKRDAESSTESERDDESSKDSERAEEFTERDANWWASTRDHRLILWSIHLRGGEITRQRGKSKRKGRSCRCIPKETTRFDFERERRGMSDTCLIRDRS